ncbi:putative sodium-coupled neutral amino acid transporter 11 isoform X3 [Vombatus ursinus]|uniref:putative sodium-coupled neutral amino acid transporter 11 isoform X3 n=1 Tax=Vombatus ursinus TaxID=29139 RepID=UPI000FFD72B9|nr:putative sodium-coupled neutral amino acid transporter 11 isoform X3 [Vombatus ursinus]
MGEWLLEEAAAGAGAKADPGLQAFDLCASLPSKNLVTSAPMGYQGQRPYSNLKRDLDDKESLVSEHKQKEKGNCRQSSAIFNVVNSITGSGIIGLPYSMQQAGLPLGILLLLWVSYVTAMISYNIITGDTLSKVFQRIPGVDPGNFFIGRHFIIGLSTVAFSLPLSLYRDIAKLGKASLISAVLTAVILIFVIVRVFTLGPYISRTEDAWVFAKPNAIQAVGIMSFAFICHHNSFLVYGSLEEPTVAKWSQVIHVSVMISAFISVLFATTGYLTFTGHTQGDLFENYCRNDDLVNFGRFCYGITVILTYPIECFVTREVIANVFFGGNLSQISHVLVTTVIITMATLVSLTVDCLGIVLEFNGVLCAAPLIFVIPSACYLKLSEERWIHPDKILASVMLLNGVIVMVVGFVMAVLHPQDCSHGQEMAYCFSTNVSFFNISSFLEPITQPPVLNISTF